MRPPFPRQGGRIDAAEFALMGPVLASYLKRFFPCDTVEFFPFDAADPGAGTGDGTAACLERVRRRRSMAYDRMSGRLFLPLWHGDEVIAAAALTGGDAYLVSQMDELRVAEKTRQVSALLHDLRDDLRDHQTGLFNASFFGRHLAAVAAAGATLGLMELAEGSHRDLLQIMAQLERCAALLVNFFSPLSPATPGCHLGSGGFAVFLPVMDDGRMRENAQFTVNWLRREGMARVRLAMVAVSPGEERKEIERRAWDTLKKARLRGAFAWAVSGRESAARLFAPPGPEALNRLRRGWKDAEVFSLVLFRADSPLAEGRELAAMLGPRLPAGALAVANGRNEVFVLLDCASEAASRSAAAVRDALAAEGDGVSVSAGIAYHPCLDYGRGAAPANCRKALLHASFYGPGSVVVFDGVSLNVSGDRYYMEGDLPGAVREYRQGLRLDPGSVTLLNSLGVALAESGRRGEAREMFLRAAETDPDDFMARYNLALLDLDAGDREAAVAGLRRCLALEPENGEALLQLAAVLSADRRYPEVAELLEHGGHPLMRKNRGRAGTRDGLVRGILHRYLARALRETGRLREAVAAAETAAGCNPKSGRSAALLAELYLDSGEDIALALSLGAKAVRLDPSGGRAWAALGRAQLAGGDAAAAEESLRRARSLAPKDSHVLELLAQVFEARGRERDAAALRARAARL